MRRYYFHVRLGQDWKAATEKFSEAVGALTGKHIGTLSREQYAALRAKPEATRLASENARLVLEMHRMEHGCGS